MTDWKRVQGSQDSKPEEFDVTSSPTTVYQRKNIHKVTTEDGELWEYDERTMSHEEFTALLNQRDVNRFEQELTDLQLAIVELYEGRM